MTPIVEQIHGATDEGTGKTYGYHGYWTKDWTA
jgi:alpha-amylase